MCYPAFTKLNSKLLPGSISATKADGYFLPFFSFFFFPFRDRTTHFLATRDQTLEQLDWFEPLGANRASAREHDWTAIHVTLLPASAYFLFRFVSPLPASPARFASSNLFHRDDYLAYQSIRRDGNRRWTSASRPRCRSFLAFLRSRDDTRVRALGSGIRGRHNSKQSQIPLDTAWLSVKAGSWLIQNSEREEFRCLVHGNKHS